MQKVFAVHEFQRFDDALLQVGEVINDGAGVHESNNLHANLISLW
jgi:hypothetical protein